MIENNRSTSRKPLQNQYPILFHAFNVKKFVWFATYPHHNNTRGVLIAAFLDVPRCLHIGEEPVRYWFVRSDDCPVARIVSQKRLLETKPFERRQPRTSEVQPR